VSEVQLRRYVIRVPERLAWAIILIASDGMLAICSDYGNYGHKWPPQGWGEGDFRSFLLEIETDYYLRSKLSKENFYSGRKTLENIRDHILNYRRSGIYTREEASEEWELVNRYAGDIELNAIGFHEWYLETHIDGAGELSHYTYNPQLNGFCEHIWPRFREMLQAELAGELVGSSPRYVHDFLRQHLLASRKVREPPCPLTPDPAVALRKNWSPQFVQLQRNRMCMGYYRYGSHIALGPRSKGCAFDAVGEARQRLKDYQQDGNQEHLLDAANLCMIEFCTPTAHPNPSLISVDDGKHAKPV